MEILALAKTFTQDLSLFERGTPIKCFRKRFESDTKSISHDMIKQARSCLKEVLESIRFEVDGVGDGKAWSGPEDPPHIGGPALQSQARVVDHSQRSHAKGA